MAILTMDQLKDKPSLRFQEGNEIGYFMDFAYWRGIPSDRDFYIAGTAAHDCLDLVAPGYGVKGNYGNGSIFVDRKDVIIQKAGND